MQVHWRQIEGRGIQGHSRAYLQKATHPAIREVNVLLHVSLFVRRFNFESSRSDFETGFFVGADFLKFLVQRFRVVVVGGAVGEFADLGKHIVVARQSAVA